MIFYERFLFRNAKFLFFYWWNRILQNICDAHQTIFKKCTAWNKLVPVLVSFQKFDWKHFGILQSVQLAYVVFLSKTFPHLNLLWNTKPVEPILYSNDLLIIVLKNSSLYPRSPKGEGGILFYLCPSVLPSVQDIFRHIFLSNCWWQKSDIWSQVSYRYTILWVAFLDPLQT